MKTYRTILCSRMVSAGLPRPTSKLGDYEEELDPPEMMEFEFEVKLPEPK